MKVESRAHTKIPEQAQPADGEKLFAVPIHLDAISAFLRGRNEADQLRPDINWPTPLLGQMVGTSTERKKFGHVFAAMMLIPAAELASNARKLGKDDAVIEKGRKVFSCLDEYRVGAERKLTPQTILDINEKTADVNTPAVLLGRSVVEILRAGEYGAHLAATDALLAIKLGAFATEQQNAA